MVKQLGQGAFGQVNLVEVSQSLQTSFDGTSPRLMALKQLKFVSPEKLNDLQNEAIVLSKLVRSARLSFYQKTYEGFEVSEAPQHSDLPWNHFHRWDVWPLVRVHG